ncbi:hypothetical protein N1851_000457 [Merluccius polli]|uniref:Ig-like domain-containing protein n=1 Tax=Merluccius polli TaxID=89951 RepID=A0AA47PBU7_MERPO|nr:hypothetical protein N1851_000457 [Merluccius polli]
MFQKKCRSSEYDSHLNALPGRTPNAHLDRAKASFPAAPRCVSPKTNHFQVTFKAGDDFSSTTNVEDQSRLCVDGLWSTLGAWEHAGHQTIGATKNEGKELTNEVNQHVPLSSITGWIGEQKLDQAPIHGLLPLGGLHTGLKEAISVSYGPTRVLLVSDRLALCGDGVLEDVHRVLDRLPDSSSSTEAERPAGRRPETGCGLTAAEHNFNRALSYFRPPLSRTLHVPQYRPKYRPDARAEECYPTVLAKRETFTVPLGGNLSLSCVVQHCGDDDDWKGTWYHVDDDDGRSPVVDTPRRRLGRLALSANQTRFLLHIQNFTQSDKGAYGCKVTWESGATAQGHMSTVYYATAVAATERSVLHRGLVCGSASVGVLLVLLLARCLSSGPKPYQTPGRPIFDASHTYEVVQPRHQIPQTNKSRIHKGILETIQHYVVLQVVYTDVFHDASGKPRRVQEPSEPTVYHCIRPGGVPV